MRISVRYIAIAVATVLFARGAKVDAAVFLSFTNGSGTPTSTTVSAGSSFPFTLKLTSTDAAANDMVTSVDYYLQASTSNIFKIASRNTTSDGSAFAFTDNSDAGVAQASAGPGLNPANGQDLGASQTNITDPPVSNTTVVIADYVISVASNATPGVYTLITTEQQAGVGYADANSTEHGFSSAGTYTVSVTSAPTPEPAAAGLLAGVAIMGLCRRNRRCVESMGPSVFGDGA